MSTKIIPKSKSDQKKMIEGGKKLAKVKSKLKEAVRVGVSAAEIEKLAVELIRKQGGKPSFKMVPKYSWATCVNVNEGIVHGIPKRELVFKKGDVVSVDIGLFYKGFHTDTSFSVGLKVNEKIRRFLDTGEKALKRAIEATVPGNRIYDISEAIEERLKESGYNPVKSLVGHGVGKDLHEEPQIPCYTSGSYKDSPKIPKGAAFAIEVMYSLGSSEIALTDDGWTINTRDGKISALFEETVITADNGTKVLTA
jgi:methionyl aminopeptidase